MASKQKDKKSPEQQAQDKAASDLKGRHPAEYDELLKGHKEKQKEQS